MATETSHRVVIVGCGFAGLLATYALRRAPVTIIDRTSINVVFACGPRRSREFTPWQAVLTRLL